MKGTMTLIALAALTTPAIADDSYPPPVADPGYSDETFGEMIHRIGFGLTAGGGVQGFTNDTLRDSTNDGGNWDVRATIGTRSLLGFEASYIGSAQSIDALGLDSDAMLIGNGAQGALRLNTTMGRTPFQPFLYGGIAWRRYDVTNSSVNTSDFADSDDVLEVPLGVGLGYKVGGLMLEARGEFRIATQEDLFPAESPDSAGDSASMHRWGVTANIGVEL